MSVRWSILVQPLDEPEPWLSEGSDLVLRTASIGKVLVLAEAARRLEDGSLEAHRRVRRADTLAIGDSGVWDHLDQEDLSVLDVCRLIGLASDNLATNALIDVVGLDAVHALTEQFELAPLAQHDYVRDPRDPSQPGVAEVLSEASAAALIRYFGLLHTGVVDDRVRQWLALDTDTSMVAGALGMDPLAHTDPDRGFTLAHKTGTEHGIRCDTGLIGYGGRTVAYAVLANWDADAEPGDGRPDTRDEVLARMNDIGGLIRARLLG